MAALFLRELLCRLSVSTLGRSLDKNQKSESTRSNSRSRWDVLMNRTGDSDDGIRIDDTVIVPN
jgi:hypothetical protein